MTPTSATLHESTAVYAVAADLTLLLQGATNFRTEVLPRVREWAIAHNMENADRGSSPDTVWLGADVVVKSNYVLSSINAIPEEYRPEHVEVWKGSHNTGFAEVVVVQPRYKTPDTDTERETMFSFLSGVLYDARPDNWGLRADGSPVLFDW